MQSRHVRKPPSHPDVVTLLEKHAVICNKVEEELKKANYYEIFQQKKLISNLHRRKWIDPRPSPSIGSLDVSRMKMRTTGRNHCVCHACAAFLWLTVSSFSYFPGQISRWAGFAPLTSPTVINGIRKILAYRNSVSLDKQNEQALKLHRRAQQQLSNLRCENFNEASEACLRAVHRFVHFCNYRENDVDHLNPRSAAGMNRRDLIFESWSRQLESNPDAEKYKVEKIDGVWQLPEFEPLTQ